MLAWTLDTDGHYHSTDGGVENGFDSHADALNQVVRLGDRDTYLADLQVNALTESITRLRDSGNDLHDDGLILALAASGAKWWTIAGTLGLADGYTSRASSATPIVPCTRYRSDPPRGNPMTEHHMPSDRQQLVQARFDAHGVGPVGAWIETQRQAGKSWAAISFAIRDLVGLDVSYETLRRWSAKDEEEEVTPGADTD